MLLMICDCNALFVFDKVICAFLDVHCTLLYARRRFYHHTVVELQNFGISPGEVLSCGFPVHDILM